MATKQIQKKETQEVSVPSYLHDDDTGTDNISSSEIVIPRIKICQAMSDIKKDNKEIKDGEIYSNMAEVFGENISFFVLLFWKSIVWFSNDKKLLCTQFSDPETKEFIQFGNDVSVADKAEEQLSKEKITMLDSYNYMLLPEKILKQALKKGEIPFPYIYAGGSAAIKYCRQLNGKVKTNAMKKIPIYGQLVSMDTKLDNFKAGDAYMPRFSYGRFADEAEFAFLKSMYKSCKQLLRRSEAHTYDDEPIETGKTEEKPIKKSHSAPDETEKLFD